MPNERKIYFEPFALDLVNECLWKGPQPIKLRPKAFAVLAHLVGRPGQLVTKQHLIGEVWQDTFVGDAVLKVAVRQIREALADDPKSPRFIETAHRRGYRFIGQIDTLVPAAADRGDAAAPTLTFGLPNCHTEVPPAIVGRDHALAQMDRWLEAMRAGERQIVFVTGEPGIGKTTLLDSFMRRIAADRRVRICSGQCLEQYGMSEAYLPVLEAIRHLCREDASVVDVLRAHAPMWLAEMPSLVTPTEREAFGREVFGASRERMLREIGEALDALTADTPLVLALEDLHWSDYSTLDLISYLARRRRSTRLMLVGTYRPAELIASGHPLRAVKQELLAKQQCEELPLEYLSEAAVAEHLDARFPGHRFPAALAALIHERTEGNPLFMVNTIDYLVGERLIEQRNRAWCVTAAIDAIKLGVPDSIRHLIEKQIDRLDAADQRLLEVASAAGAEFPAPAVSAGLDDAATDVELRFEELSRRHHFVRNCGVQRLPSGAIVDRYGFVHAVYRNVLYDRVSASRQMLLHRRLGEWGEAAYRERAGEIAAELAMHFERATDHERAVRYLQQAARNAMQRSAYREAVALSRRGLQLLAALPDSEARAGDELRLLLTLGVPLIATEGYAAPAVGSAYIRARALCQRLGDPPEISQVLWGLWTFHVLSADLATAHSIAQEMLQLADRRPEPGMVMRGHWAMEITCTHRGEFAQAVAHFERAIAAYEPDRHRDDAFLYALNPGVAMRCFAAWSMWFVGQVERALVVMQEGVALARELWEPHGLAHALVFASILHQLRGDRSIAFRYADEAITIASDHGLVLYLAMALVIRGWALIESGDRAAAIDHIRRGLAAWQTTGAELMRPHFLALLVEALDAETGHDEALRVIADALAMTESTGERCYQAELYRLKGERLFGRATDQQDVDAAAQCLEEALAIAGRQHARSLEVRAATSLARIRSRRQ